MFENLSEKFSKIFSRFAGQKQITEEGISSAISDVRLALLDADVNYTVVKNFIKKVKERALGVNVIKSVSAAEQFIQMVHEELVQLMGGGEAELVFKERPAVILLCGLQGTGKTTQAAKLANYLMKGKRKPLLAACDLARPAAILQLKMLGEKIGVEVFSMEGERSALKVAASALKEAKERDYDTLIIDTAGRLHIDDELMGELSDIKAATNPSEILFVASAQTGQDAVKAALQFDERLNITGSILTMLDGDSRGGAAISILEVTKKPIKFEGVGERVDDFQLFDARSMADRILGMGDTINLVKRAKEHVSEEEAKKLEEKVMKATFTYEDYLKQIQSVRKMGSFRKVFSMMPGASQFNLDESEEEMKRVEAIILSMTVRERQGKDEITHFRAKRVASGSGTDVGEVNRLKKSFQRTRDLMRSGKNRKALEKLMNEKTKM